MNGAETAPVPEFATDSEHVGTDEADWIVLPEEAEAATSLEGDDVIIGGVNENGIEACAGDGSDYIMGSSKDDTLFANGGGYYEADGGNVIDAGAGDDGVFGTDGNYILSGGRGDDFIHGQGGHDMIRGGRGGDVIMTETSDGIVLGGKGANTVAYDSEGIADIELEHMGNKVYKMTIS